MRSRMISSISIRISIRKRASVRGIDDKDCGKCDTSSHHLCLLEYLPLRRSGGFVWCVCCIFELGLLQAQSAKTGRSGTWLIR